MSQSVFQYQPLRPTTLTPEQAAAVVADDNGAPIITFGVEMEFFYAFHISTLDGFLIGPPEQRTEATKNYVSQIIQYPALDQNQGFIEPVASPVVHSYNGPKEEITFTQWSLINEASLGISHDEVAEILGYRDQGREDVILREWHFQAMELISPAFDIVDENLWLRQLLEIQRALELTNIKGAMINDTCGLHVHMAINGRPQLQAQTMKNLVVIWGVCEELINRMHPENRNTNIYAQSLRSRYEQYSHHNFALRIYTMPDDVLILQEVIGARFGQKRNSKINFSPACGTKPITVEFREAAGTLDATEIYWWVRFCEGVLRFAHHLAIISFTIYDFSSEQNPGLSVYQALQETLLERVLPPAGIQFYTDRIARLDLEKQPIEEPMDLY